MVNTLGAIGGSLLSAIFVDREPKEVRLPTTVSFGRRLVGLACDVVFVVVLGAIVALGYRAVADDLDVQTWLQLGVPFAAEALCVLVLGRTVGEWVVDTRTRPRRRGPVLGWRVVKLVVGVGPMLGLAFLDGWWVVLGLAAYAVLTVVSNPVAGLEIEIDVEAGARSDA